MTQQQPPYGQPPPQGYGPPPQGYAAPPQGPPPKKKMGTLGIVLLTIGGIFVLGMGSCLVCVGIGAKGVADAEKQQQQRRSGGGTAATPGAAAAAPVNAQPVDIKVLLSEYKDNEVRGDGEFKGKAIRVTGKVSNVKKGLMDGMYVEVGTGKAFEIPEVQCELNDSNAQQAASLSKGQNVTVEGTVGGLMMNVRLEDCDIVP